MLFMLRFGRCEPKDIHLCVLGTDSCLSHGPSLLVCHQQTTQQTLCTVRLGQVGTCPTETDMSHLSAGLGCLPFGVRLLS